MLQFLFYQMKVDGGKIIFKPVGWGKKQKRLRFSKISPGVPPMGKHRDEEAACTD